MLTKCSLHLKELGEGSSTSLVVLAVEFFEIGSWDYSKVYQPSERKAPPMPARVGIVCWQNSNLLALLCLVCWMFSPVEICTCRESIRCRVTIANSSTLLPDLALEFGSSTKSPYAQHLSGRINWRAPIKVAQPSSHCTYPTSLGITHTFVGNHNLNGSTRRRSLALRIIILWNFFQVSLQNFLLKLFVEFVVFVLRGVCHKKLGV